MQVIRKDATIANTDTTDDDFPGSFEVILSAPTLDRDGETILAEEWKTPLPDHITFDTDHGMSVASTVGSGVPRIDEKTGNLLVTGTYSSLPRAQEVRTLVKEGHINRTSVAFARGRKVMKDGTSRVERELLNGAFVAVPANREAAILNSKSGARNAKSDQQHIDAIYRHAVALGATPDDSTGGDTSADEDVAAAKAVSRATVKTVAGSYEQAQAAINDALSAAYPSSDDDDRYVYAYPTATFPSTVVYRVSGGSDDAGQWQAAYAFNDDGTVTLGTPSRVNLVEQIVPLDEGATENADPAAGSGPAAAAKAAAAGTEPAAAPDASTQQELIAARKRYYATLSGRNQ